jgi:hypothetical protein
MNTEIKSTYVEGGVPLTVGVEVAPIGVTGSGISVSGVGASAGVVLAALLADSAARMRSVCRADRVGLPDVHLGAARAASYDVSTSAGPKALHP